MNILYATYNKTVSTPYMLCSDNNTKYLPSVSTSFKIFGAVIVILEENNFLKCHLRSVKSFE